MKRLIVVLSLIGGILMINPVDAFLKNNAENIVHRKNLTTGIVKVVNANLSFDVEIGNCGKTTKRIFTLSPEPDLAVDDEVLIGYLKGNKGDPIIFAPTVPAPIITIVRRYALIVHIPSELRTYNMDGVLAEQVAIAGGYYSAMGVAVDSQGNVYIKEREVFYKYDSNLNLLVTRPIESGSKYIEGINIGSDGYLYSLEDRALGYAIAKRNVVDLTIVEDVFTLATGNYGGEICLDSSGNFYIYNWSANEIEKWSSAGVKLASINPGPVSEYAGCGICGNYIYFIKYSNEIYYLPLDLSTYTIWNLPVGIAYCLTVADNHLFLSGWGTGGDGATRKYDSDGNLIWETFLDGADYAYKAGSYNF